MFERCTGQSRRALFLAHQEARRFGHDYVGTDHLLLGVLREGSGAAARLLEGLGADAELIRKAAESRHGAALDTPPFGHLPLTPSARRALDHAAAEADRLHQHSVGPGHLLLGLLHEREGEGAQALLGLDLDLDTLRARVLEQPPDDNRDQMVQPERRPGSSASALSDPSPADLEALFSAEPVAWSRTEPASLRRRISDVPLHVDRGAEVARQLRLTQLALGTLAGAVAGAMAGGRNGVMLGLLAGLAVAAVRIRALSAVAGATAGIFAGAQHFPGRVWPSLLGAVIGALIGACLGEPPAAPTPPQSSEPPEQPDDDDAAK